MGVELVEGNNPSRLGVGFYRLGNMIGKIELIAGELQGRMEHLSLGNMPGGNQTVGSHDECIQPRGAPLGRVASVASDGRALTPEFRSSQVLSACDTGRGRITEDGMIRLSRSRITVGVPSIVVSLWKVPDESTALLMTEFYKNLKTSSDAELALCQAMLTTKRQHPDPLTWATLTLDWRSRITLSPAFQ